MLTGLCLNSGVSEFDFYLWLIFISFHEVHLCRVKKRIWNVNGQLKETSRTPWYYPNTLYPDRSRGAVLGPVQTLLHNPSWPAGALPAPSVSQIWAPRPPSLLCPCSPAANWVLPFYHWRLGWGGSLATKERVRVLSCYSLPTPQLPPRRGLTQRLRAAHGAQVLSLWDISPSWTPRGDIALACVL